MPPSDLDTSAPSTETPEMPAGFPDGSTPEARRPHRATPPRVMLLWAGWRPGPWTGAALASVLVPDLSPAFEPMPTDPEVRSQYETILSGIEVQLKDAATKAFSLSFLISALFGLLALIPIGMTRRLDL